MVNRAAASCSKRHASVEKTNAQSSSVPNVAPDLAAVVIVPGPIKAAETTDQKRISRMRFFADIESFKVPKYKNQAEFLYFSLKIQPDS